MKRSTPEFPLAQLTTTLMNEVFESISATAIEQTQAFAEVAGQAGVPFEQYLAKVIGATSLEQQDSARGYIARVLLPLLELPGSPIADPVLFSKAAAQRLREHLARIVAEGLVISDSVVPLGPFWSISYAQLESFALEKLRRDTRQSHQSLAVLLSEGVPRVLVTGGQISTKMTMRVSSEQRESSSSSQDAALRAKRGIALKVRVAEERSVLSSKSAELVGSVRIEFKTSSYPPIQSPSAQEST